MPSKTLQSRRGRSGSNATPRRRTARPRSAGTAKARATPTTPSTPTAPASVTGVLERLGRAFGAGDLPGVAACFAYPSFLLTGADTHEFRDPMQVQTVFRRSLAWQTSAGIVSTRPEFDSVTPLGSGIYDCTVRWPAFDSGGAVVANERAHYIIQESAVGTALIRVAVAIASQGDRSSA
jgi:hypothetical protein